MTREIENLQNAFREQQVQPTAEARAGAISAAIRAFEEEKNSSTFQGSTEAVRLKGQGGKNETLSKWRHMMNSISSRWAYGLAGSASVAVLAMVVVGPNVSELLLDAGPKDLRFNKPLEIERTEVRDREVGEEAVSIKEETRQLSLDAPAPTAAPTSDAPQKLSESAAVPAVSYQTSQKLASGQVKNFAAIQSAAVEPAKGLSVPDQYPTTGFQDQGRDKFEEFETNPVKVVREEPVSTFSVDVDTASYSFMRASLNKNLLPQKNAVRIEEFINYFDYAYEAPSDESEPFKASISIMPTPWNEGTKLLSIGIKGYELPKTDTPGSNLVFLIDTSGSMNAPNKLPLLRNSFKLLLSSLKADDTVSIVTYAGSAGTVLEPTSVAEKNKIFSALDNLHAGGSTAGAEGIRQAYQLAQSSFKDGGVNRVVLATDGDFNVGISNTEELKSFIERKRETGVTLSILGFGQGNYNDELMQSLAQNGNGNAAYIDTLSEARKVLVEEAGSTLFTIARDVKLQVEFNPALVGEYRLVGYETRALEREDFNNDKVDAGDIGAGHTVTALYEITPANSEDRLIDDLRYGDNQVEFAGDSSEYGFLKIRYKLPGSDTSTLITQPIDTGNQVDSLESASADNRFAAGVAAFGQLLRGGQYTKSYTYDDVIALARSGKGVDEFGYRAEFINLVRLAKSAAALQPLAE